MYPVEKNSATDLLLTAVDKFLKFAKSNPKTVLGSLEEGGWPIYETAK